MHYIQSIVFFNAPAFSVMIVPMKITFELTTLTAYRDMTIAAFLIQEGYPLFLPCGGNGTCMKCKIEATFPGSPFSPKKDYLACQNTIGDLMADITAQSATSIYLCLPDPATLPKEDSANHKPSVSASYAPADPDCYVAVDLGSTTIAMELFRPDGEVIHTFSAQNPQQIYGSDVLSRIRSASQSSFTRSDLQRLAESKIQEGLAHLEKKAELPDHRAIRSIAIAANTTMGHLLTGEDVSPLGHAPFAPGNIDLTDITSVFFIKEEHPPTVYRMPGISAFVGGDILSGIYALDMDLNPGWSLLLDLGTNGEMALARRKDDTLTIYCASTAAGPAFEAANISCGCAGVEGAIYKVSIQPGGRCVPSIIKNTPAKAVSLPSSLLMQQRLKEALERPLGLCGSGVISAVSALYRAGLIDEHATFQKERYRHTGYPLWQRPKEEPLLLTQEDIRQLQMAKAAIAAGIDCLLRAAQITTTDLSHVYLAGGFGKGLDPKEAAAIGLLPKEVLPVTTAVGNSALAGAKKFLLQGDTGRLQRIQNSAREILLAEDPAFEALYLKHLNLPN
ncbi:Uncharacterized 2Fe-2 and 4Fe-4S clusters-containing protein, contains DUF4445 domain [Lachnospiraceae bacterium C10]|nr:Uncharacterized 2Fe-2 and 4Fe-4S clusters-containing protein, contains DUF4445 domain [Lachnospiraceae bacterium C10]